jgi:hypothetical protein
MQLKLAVVLSKAGFLVTMCRFIREEAPDGRGQRDLHLVPALASSANGNARITYSPVRCISLWEQLNLVTLPVVGEPSLAQPHCDSESVFWPH